MDNQLSLFEPILVSLPNGRTALIDPVDSDLLNYHWYELPDKYRPPYLRCRINKKTRYIHRVIMERILERSLVYGEEVDHINGDSLDNRRENLRLATRAENARNSRKPQNNTSGYKGVSRSKRAKYWRAAIRKDGDLIILGYFDTPEEAYAAYCEASLKYHGEFGRTE